MKKKKIEDFDENEDENLQKDEKGDENKSKMMKNEKNYEKKNETKKNENNIEVGYQEVGSLVKPNHK